VTDHPGFGVLLARLLRHRGTDITWLSASCGVGEPEIRSVLDGAPPDESQLHALAPALGFHRAFDNYVLGLVVRALDDLGYAPGEDEMPTGNNPVALHGP
jgi:hypothetical protein